MELGVVSRENDAVMDILYLVPPFGTFKLKKSENELLASLKKCYRAFMSLYHPDKNLSATVDEKSKYASFCKMLSALKDMMEKKDKVHIHVSAMCLLCYG